MRCWLVLLRMAQTADCCGAKRACQDLGLPSSLVERQCAALSGGWKVCWSRIEVGHLFATAFLIVVPGLSVMPTGRQRLRLVEAQVAVDH